MFKVNTSHKDEKLSDEEISLENGFVSEEHQLKMETVQRYENDNWRKVRLTFGGQAFKDHHIKGLEFSDLFGNPIDADEDGRSTSNNRPRKIYYRFKTELPDEIMFTIVKYGEVKTEEIPFQIENVSLLGKKQNTGKKNE